MKNKNSKLTMLVAVVVLATFLTFGMTVSLLMDHEQQDNIITIGKVELAIEETSFPTETQTLSAGSKIAKDPVIKNTGKNDEYVFIRLAIPKKSVTLLYEQDTNVNSETKKQGTPIGTRSTEEIFKTIVESGAEQETVSVENNTADLKYVIWYRKGDSTTSKEGWYYLSKDLTSNADFDYYYFGYNSKLLAKNGDTEDKTVPLFNYVQLKSFVDGEIDGGTDVNVEIEAYGIQADQLGINGLPDGEGLMTLEKVRDIFDIVKRKQGIT